MSKAFGPMAAAAVLMGATVAAAMPPPRPAEKSPTARPAAIKPDQRVAVVNIGEVDLAMVRTVQRLYKALKSGRLGKPVPDAVLRSALAGAPFDSSQLEAEELLRKARLAYAALKRSDAINLLKRAEALYLRHVPLSRAKKGLGATWTYLLLSLHDLGLRARARSVVRSLTGLTAGKKPAGIPSATWRQYRPTTRFRRVVRVIKIMAPAGASVYVDFRKIKPAAAKGPAPSSALHVARVDTRAHHLAVEAKGRRRFYRKLSAQRTSMRVLAVLPPAPVDAHRTLRTSLARIRTLKPARQPSAVAALLKPHNLARALVVFPEAAHLTVRLLDVRTATYLGPATKLSLPMNPTQLAALKKWTGTVRAAVAKAVADAATGRPGPEKLKPREAARKAAREVAGKKKPLSKKKKKAKPLWKQWYFWVAAAAVATVITVFALRKDESGTVEVKVYRP